MHHDSQLYYVPNGFETWHETIIKVPASSWMKLMSSLTPSTIVEVPADWHLDDWPPLQPEGGNGFADTRVIEQLWKDQFDYHYCENESFVFPMSIHPQVSRKPQVVLMHVRLIEYFNRFEGAEWCTVGEMVKEFKEGRISGVSVEGGDEEV
jgi:hypothetical protein